MAEVKRTRLVLQLKEGEDFTAGDIRIKYYERRGNQIRLAIESPETTKIVRKRFKATVVSRGLKQ